MNRLADVLRYAARGWQVFPVQPKSKHPACTRGFYEATNNPATLQRWFARFDYNVGVRTGVPGGIFVFDVDGDAGVASLCQLEFEHGKLPATLTSITGNGQHYWFSFDAPLPSSTGRIGAGLDVKADGGYVVAPMSIHPSGKTYRWVDDTIPPAPAPEWLVHLARKPKPIPISERALARVRSRWIGQPGVYGRAALDAEIRILASTAPGGRNLNVSHGIIQAGISPRTLERVQVASIQTLHRRAIHAATMSLPPADLLWVDEGHHCPAATYRKIIEGGQNGEGCIDEKPECDA